jgi:hypothetical protein
VLPHLQKWHVKRLKKRIRKGKSAKY